DPSVVPASMRHRITEKGAQAHQRTTSATRPRTSKKRRQGTKKKATAKNKAPATPRPKAAHAQPAPVVWSTLTSAGAAGISIEDVYRAIAKAGIKCKRQSVRNVLTR